MEKNNHFLSKPILRRGKIVYQSVKDPDLEVKHFFCSTFIEKENILVKGEYRNPQPSRKALLAFFDLETGRIIGGAISLIVHGNLKGSEKPPTRIELTRSASLSSKARPSCWGPVEAESSCSGWLTSNSVNFLVGFFAWKSLVCWPITAR